LNWQFLYEKIGMELDKKMVIKILQSLGFGVKENKEGLLVNIPTWRATKDISIAEDLVEEISRIYGYDNIEKKLPSFPIIPPEVNQLRELERNILDIFVRNLNYSESYNYSFVSAKQIKNISDDLDKYIELDNPISKEKPYLRRGLLLNLLENAVKNIEFFDTVRLVEIGKVFRAEEAGQKMNKIGDELLPRQDIYLMAIYTNKKDDNPFNELRFALEKVLENFNLQFNLTASNKIQYQHPTRSGQIQVGDVHMGDVYQLHPQIAHNFGLETNVGVLEINLNRLLECVGVDNIKYEKISEYPQVIRDLAIVIKDEIDYIDIQDAIMGIDPTLQKVQLFDIYRGTNIGEGYKSMAFHLSYVSKEKTLESKEVDNIQKEVIKKLETNFDAQVRR